MTADWDIVATRPAILADVLEVMPALLRLRYANPRPPWRKRFVLLRFADVIRRVTPEEALAVLEGDLPDDDQGEVPHLAHPAVMAATLLEMSRAEEASGWLARVRREGGAAELLEGRLALQEGHLDEADKLYELAAAAARMHPHPLTVEVELEAMGHRVRLAMARQQAHGALHRQLERRLQEANAGVTISVFRQLVLRHEPDVRERRLDRTVIGIKTHILRTYAAPYESEREAIAPIPLHVHGLAKALRDDPMKYVSGVSTLASIQWRQGDRQNGYETAAYGEAIARRVWGPKVADVLQDFVEQLLEPLPPEQRRAYAWRMERTAREAQLRRQQSAANREP